MVAANYMHQFATHVALGIFYIVDRDRALAHSRKIGRLDLSYFHIRKC